jgi:hypothetical protein
MSDERNDSESAARIATEITVRSDLARAHDAAWQHLGRAGTWLAAEGRIA